MLVTEMESLPGGRRLRVARLGSGPPLVLLHGYPDNLQIWSGLAPLLARHFEVIAFDWPGMGYSHPWPGGATPVHMADRLAELLNFLKIPRTAVVGMDMGGQPSLVWAAKYPDRISHLVVMNCLALGDEETSWEIRVLRKFGWNRWILRQFPRLVFQRAKKTFLPPGVALPEDLEADLWESFRRPPVREFIVKMCAGYQGTLARLPEFYRRVTCPTLVLWGERDKHFPPIQGKRLKAQLPVSQIKILPGARHWMAWYRAPEVAEEVLRFVSSGG